MPKNLQAASVYIGQKINSSWSKEDLERVRLTILKKHNAFGVDLGVALERVHGVTIASAFIVRLLFAHLHSVDQYQYLVAWPRARAVTKRVAPAFKAS